MRSNAARSMAASLPYSATCTSPVPDAAALIRLSAGWPCAASSPPPLPLPPTPSPPPRPSRSTVRSFAECIPTAVTACSAMDGSGLRPPLSISMSTAHLLISGIGSDSVEAMERRRSSYPSGSMIDLSARMRGMIAFSRRSLMAPFPSSSSPPPEPPSAPPTEAIGYMSAPPEPELAPPSYTS